MPSFVVHNRSISCPTLNQSHYTHTGENEADQSALNLNQSSRKCHPNKRESIQDIIQSMEGLRLNVRTRHNLVCKLDARNKKNK